MPSGLIDEKDGVGSWGDRFGDFREVQVHRFGIAEGQDATPLPCFGQMAPKM